jgi:hypothetical protein
LVNSGVGWVFDFVHNHCFSVLVVNQIFRTTKPSVPDLSCPALLPPKEKEKKIRIKEPLVLVYLNLEKLPVFMKELT